MLGCALPYLPGSAPVTSAFSATLTSAAKALSSNEISISSPSPLRSRRRSAATIAVAALRPASTSNDRDADLHRRPVRLARDRHQAGLGLDDEVVAGSVARLATAEAIDRAIDHVRSAPSDGVVVEAEASSSARAEVLDHHIGARTQLERELPSFRIL